MSGRGGNGRRLGARRGRAALAVVAAAAFSVLPVAARAGAAAGPAARVAGGHRSAHPAVTVSTDDTSGDGWVDSPDVPAPATVAGGRFGVRWDVPVHGQVYAPPVVAGSTVVAATEDDEVDGLNLATGARRWRDQLGTPWPSSTVGCGDLAPDVGVTGRPALSPDGRTVYVLTKVDTAGDSARPGYLMHALSVATGAERPGWPVAIAGTAANDPGATFDAFDQLNRPALLYLDGVVYAAFGSLCDGDYARGWVVGVSAAHARVTSLWTSEADVTTTVTPLGSVWEGAGELVALGPNRIMFSTGNGLTPPDGPDTADPDHLGQADVVIAVGAGGQLRTADYFAPSDAAALNGGDRDLGSGAPTLLPPVFGTPRVPRVVVQAGKGGTIYVLDAARLGGRAPRDRAVQEIPHLPQVYSQPAAWSGDGGLVYVLTARSLIAYRPTDVGGLVHLVRAGIAFAATGYTSSSPLITSDGGDPAGALVWEVLSPSAAGARARLAAYAAVPVDGVLRQVFSAPVGTAAKFGRPVEAGGTVLVGTRDGSVMDFGPLGAPPGVPLVATAASVRLGGVAVGSTATATLTLANRTGRPVRVLAVAVGDGPFSAGRHARSVPAGGALRIPVTFAPTAVGAAASTLSVATPAGATSVALSGSGTPGQAAGTAVGDPTAGGWTFNGTAYPTASGTDLNPALPYEVGSVVYPTPVPSATLTVDFTATIGGGTGADGMTLALLDPSATTPTSLGGDGGALGFGGLAGTAVALRTYQGATDPSDNFVGVADGFADGALTYLATSPRLGLPLRGGPTQWQVTVADGEVSVAEDGTQVLGPVAVSLPPEVYVGFTGSDGYLTDDHAVSGVSIVAGP